MKFQCSIIMSSRLAKLLALAICSAAALAAAMPDASERAGTPADHPSTSATGISLFELLSGGIAAHRGDLQFAFDAIMDAAKREGSAEIAKYAWETSIAARNGGNALEAAGLWLSYDPEASAAIQTLLADAVEKNDKAAVLKHLNALESINAKMKSADAAGTGEDAQGDDEDEGDGSARKSCPGGWLAKIMRDFARTPKPELRTLLATAEPFIRKYGSCPEVGIAVAQAQLASGGGARQACDRAEAALSKNGISEKLAGEAVDICWNADAARTRRLIRNFLKKNPDNAYIRLLYGRIEMRFGNRAAAVDALSHAMKKPPKDPKLYYSAGQLAADCGEPELAEKHFRRCIARIREENPDVDLSRADIWLHLGNAALMQKAPERAIDYYGELKDGPFAAQAKMRLALAQAGLKRIGDARRTLQEARKDFPLEGPAFYSAEAKLLLELGQAEEAGKVMTDAIEAFPASIELLYDGAMLAEEAGNSKLAADRLKKLLEMNPDHVQANNALGYLYADRNENLDEARRLLKRAYDASPLDPYILDSMGWLAFREGELRKAFEFTQTSLKRRYDPEVAMHLIQILLKDGRRDKALEAYAELKNREGGSARVREFGERLQLEAAEAEPRNSAP